MGGKARTSILEIVRDRNKIRSQTETDIENWSQLETEIRVQRPYRSLIETKFSGWSQILETKRNIGRKLRPNLKVGLS